MKILLAVAGPMAGLAFALGGSTTIGRGGESDVQVVGEGVSRRHACITEHHDGSLILYDLGSGNGTRVGGKVVPSAQLAPGDQIEVGDTTFELREVADGTHTIDHLDMKLLSGPAIDSTVIDDRRAKKIAALVEAQHVASLTVCCDSPLSADARENGWVYCPACGSSVL